MGAVEGPTWGEGSYILYAAGNRQAGTERWPHTSLVVAVNTMVCLPRWELGKLCVAR
jgi:hypothetical protein